MSAIAVLPARYGSKRIPQKNIRLLDGIPLIGHTLQIVANSGIFDEIIVSSDNTDMLQISKKYGATKIEERNAELSTDYISTWQVVSNTVKNFDLFNSEVCCIYPSSIFLSSNDLKMSKKLLSEFQNDYIVSIYEPNTSSYRTFQLDVNNHINMIFPEYEHLRSQDLPLSFADAGLFYWGMGSTWLTNENILGPRSQGFRVSLNQVIDLNTLDDWEFLEDVYFGKKARGKS